MLSAVTNKSIRGVLAALVLASITPLAFAQAMTPIAGSSAGDDGGVGLRYGSGKGYQRATLGYETAPLWRYDFGGNWGHVNLTIEPGISYWWTKGGNDHKPGDIWQLSAIPMFRWYLGDRFFLEGGVGPTVFNHTVFAGHTISSAYQFGDQIGLGFQINQHNKISIRYSHFSNADIKRPNPGLDVTEVGYTYQF